MAMIILIEGAQFCAPSILFLDFHPYKCCKIRSDFLVFALILPLFHTPTRKIIRHINSKYKISLKKMLIFTSAIYRAIRAFSLAL